MRECDITRTMRKPTLVRPLTEDERNTLTAGLRSSNAFVLRRCQIVLASDRGEYAPAIGRVVGCDDETVRRVVRGFNAHGVAVLQRGSCRPQTVQGAFSPETADRLCELLHHSPRTFGKPTSLWTLDLAAEVGFEQGLTAHQVSGETVRMTLQRKNVTWKRAKHWLTSPDPAYARKKTHGTA
jgi:hypothetical protein